MSTRGLLATNVAFRLCYGIGGLFAPAAMARLRFVPDAEERPDARLFIRGFSAHQVGVAMLGLAGLRWQRLQRPAAAAAVTIDAADVISAAIEARDREEMNADLIGGTVFSVAGLATAWSALSRQP